MFVFVMVNEAKRYFRYFATSVHALFTPLMSPSYPTNYNTQISRWRWELCRSFFCYITSAINRNLLTSRTFLCYIQASFLPLLYNYCSYCSSCLVTLTSHLFPTLEHLEHSHSAENHIQQAFYDCSFKTLDRS